MSDHNYSFQETLLVNETLCWVVTRLRIFVLTLHLSPVVSIPGATNQAV